MKSKLFKILIRLVILLVVLYAVLLIPESSVEPLTSDDKAPFAWNADQYWDELETQFAEARKLDCDSIANIISSKLHEFKLTIGKIKSNTVDPKSPYLSLIEKQIFELSVLIGACPNQLNDFIKAFGELRSTIKNQSTNWDMSNQTSREAIYRILYGGRTAIEEIILQAPDIILPDVFIENNEPSQTPSAEILGVRIHSGDILVSRGGAPTSALIARGNDYPGNFSHIALVHVDEKSHEVSIIESHIEIGGGDC